MAEQESAKRAENRSERFGIFKSISVEPATFVLLVGTLLSYLIDQNLLMDTICRVDLDYGEQMCRDIIHNGNASHYESEEREIQKKVASLSTISTIIKAIPSVILILVVGPFSDAKGRKVPMLYSVLWLTAYPLFLIIFGCLLMGSINGLSYSIITAIPFSLAGGPNVLVMCAFSYISDTTKIEDRTMRMGLLSAAMTASTPIGNFFAGLTVSQGVGEGWALLMAVSLGVVACGIILWRVENKTPAELRGRLHGTSIKTEEKQSKEYRENVDTICAKIKSFILELYKLWSGREDKWAFGLLIMCHFFYTIPSEGERVTIYLFMREKLGWNMSDYGFFSTYNWLMSTIGVVITMFVLSKWLKVSDPVLGILGGLSQIAGSLTYAFAMNPVMVYLAAGLDMMNGTIAVAVKSMLSKMVEAEEAGKLFSLLGLLSSLIPVFAAPVYSFLYRSTLGIFTGSVFALSAALTLPAIFVFIAFLCKGKRFVGEHRGSNA